MSNKIIRTTNLVIYFFKKVDDVLFKLGDRIL